MVTESGLPPAFTSIWSLAPVIVVLAASGVAAATVAPEEAWVTLIEWDPTVRPDPAEMEARPRAAPPEPTARVTEPAWDPEEMVPVAMDELDELAEKASS